MGNTSWKHTCILVVVILLSGCSGDKWVETFELDSSKNEGYVKYDENGNEVKIGEWKGSYVSGAKWYVGQYDDNGLKTGWWVLWFVNGQKDQEGLYDKGQNVGDWKFWHENGQLKASGKYTGGKQEGSWTYWHSNGTKQAEGKFEDSLKKGVWKYWDSEGNESEQEHN